MAERAAVCDQQDQPSASATYTLTQQQVDAIAEFFIAAVEVARYGMNQPTICGGHLGCTGNRFRDAAKAAFPLVGMEAPKEKADA